MRNNLRIYRAIENITQEELAKRVGISRQAINAIENDRMSPNLIHAFKITKSLKTERSLLIGFVEECRILSFCAPV